MWRLILDSLCMVVMLVLACLIVLPYSFVAALARRVLILMVQSKALRGVASHQRILLEQLWWWENRCRDLHELYSGGYFELSPQLEFANLRADETIKRCREVRLDEWRIDAFRIKRYDDLGPFPLVS